MLCLFINLMLPVYFRGEITGAAIGQRWRWGYGDDAAVAVALYLRARPRILNKRKSL